MKKKYTEIANKLRRNYDEKVVRKLGDMSDRYENQEEVKRILKKGNPEIYRVFARELEEGKMAGLTILNPGKIGDEYYMTKGHAHKKPLPEIYILLKGKGKLILQSTEKNYSRIVDLKKGKEIFVSGKMAHRVANTGKEKMEMLAFYDKEAGHDYKTKFKRRVKSV